MSVPSTEKVAVAGLARWAAFFFWGWGGVAGAKGLWDIVGGQPEARFFSSVPWSIVTRAQWARFALFELTLGLACAGLGGAAWILARRLPRWVERPVSNGIQ